MSNNTSINLKRTTKPISDLNNETLSFGEPLLIDSNDNKYLVIGPNGQGTSIENSIFFRGLSKQDAERSVTYTENGTLVTAPNTNNIGEYLKIGAVFTQNIENIDEGSSDDKYYIVCRNVLQSIDTNGNIIDPDIGGRLYNFKLDNDGIYIDGRGVMHGAAWNDYAEARICNECETPHQLDGYVVCESGDGTVKLSTKRLQPCAYVVSDTYGSTIGSGNINVGLAGKALVYTDDDVEIGDCLTAGENGKAVKMTRQEIINYPDRILGIVIEIPDYDKYNDIKINGRIWIRLK